MTTPDPAANPPAPIVDLYAARVEFTVSMENAAPFKIALEFPDPTGDAEAALLQLWRIGRAEQLQRAKREPPTLALLDLP